MVNVTKDVFRSVEIENVRINEGDKIKFVTESGELKKGVITKISGKGEKTKIQIVPENSSCEEVWSVLVINEGTLKLDEGEGQ